MKTTRWALVLGGISGLILTVIYFLDALPSLGDPVSYAVYFSISAIILLLCGIFFNKKWAPYLFLLLIVGIVSSVLIPVKDGEFPSLFLYGFAGSLIFGYIILPLLFWGSIIVGLSCIKKWFRTTKAVS
jgi:hypothetical protein